MNTIREQLQDARDASFDAQNQFLMDAIWDEVNHQLGEDGEDVDTCAVWSAVMDEDYAEAERLILEHMK